MIILLDTGDLWDMWKGVWVCEWLMLLVVAIVVAVVLGDGAS